MSAEDILEKLKNERLSFSEVFDIIKSITVLLASQGNSREVIELVLRLAERRGQLGECEEMLDSLLRRVGLFPYVEPNNLSAFDQVAYECHRPESVGLNGIVFHRVQANLFHRILAGENIVLSAPTSFGKSLLIDAIVAEETFNNIVIVVPTIALIDETRRRLSEIQHSYKIITHASQSKADRNIFLLTPERVLDIELPKIDFFVIDEFYKLALGEESNTERSAILNHAFQRLWKTKAQYYLLGPNIQSISPGFEDRYGCKFISTDFATVVSEVHRVQLNNQSAEERLLELCSSLLEPTIVFCSSPNRAAHVARLMLESGTLKHIPALTDAVNWISTQFDREWIFPKALGSGIGIHHGRLPRSLAQYVVRKFNEGQLRYLICTSTLIEGVNTKAKNIIIFDNKVAKKNLDYFTFNNIRGRSGRMFQHFVGRTYLFHDPPQGVLRTVEIPLIEQKVNTPASLLIQLESDDLSNDSKSRVADFYAQQSLSIETLRSNVGVDPDMQLAVARLLSDSPQQWQPLLSWTGRPSYKQLEAVCTLIWKQLVRNPSRIGGALTDKQLAYKIRALSKHSSIPALIANEVKKDGVEIDEAIGTALDFARQWAGFHFPKSLMALDRIQRDVFSRIGMSYGDYSSFAESVESLFLPRSMVMLEEYGLPIQLAKKLSLAINFDQSLDDSIQALRRWNPTMFDLSPFEKELVLDVKKYLR